MTFIEHNNRNIAKKFAEYITGEELRKYCKNKIEKYLGSQDITVFDGAVGSGQLEQFLNLKYLYGVDVQKESIEALKENYVNSSGYNKSFFEFDEDIKADVTLMNPPFSLKFKDLSKIEQDNIKKEFPWKKSGVVDDIFVLKGLNYTKRFGFYIVFPGVAYRKTELMLRKEVGNRLLEINEIKNAFEDTSINVLFLVIDKEKESTTVESEVYDCKLKKVLLNATLEIDVDRWQCVREEIEIEEINIKELEDDLDKMVVKNLRRHLETKLFTQEISGKDNDIQGFINKINEVLDDIERRL